MRTRDRIPGMPEPSSASTDPCSGVSEVVGSFLLISIVVLAIAIIGVVLLSQTGPQQVPDVNFMVGTNSNTPPTLYLYHNGGDPLTIGQFNVIVDNTVIPPSGLRVSDYGTTWSLGKSLVIPLSFVPKSIVLVYNKTGSNAVVLRSASVNVSSLSGNIKPEVMAGSSYPPVIDVTQLMQNINNRSIDFYRENGTTPSGTLQFNVTGVNSTITTNVSVISLETGNVVVITTNSGTQSLRIAGIGDEIWELNADSVNLKISNRSSPFNDQPVIIYHSWITGYKDFQSGLTLSATTGVANYTALAINNYPSSSRMQAFTGTIINGSNPDKIVISNPKPTSTGLFILQYDKIRGMYFVGDATGITRNTNSIYP